MRINFNNTYFPKPILCEKCDDYVNNNFKLIIQNEIDKEKQELILKIMVEISNDSIIKLIAEDKIVPILHIEQKTQRDSRILSIDSLNEVIIDLFQYATTEPIELIGILYCASSFEIDDISIFNSVYSLLENKICYERGDILGFSNEFSINLPEDKKIGSIFNAVPDTENILKGKPFKISLDGELIQITMNEDIHNKFITIYNNDGYVKRIMFSTIVYPATVIAFVEMFNSYELYKDKKWCRTLALKIEKVKNQKAEDLFTNLNYDMDKVYEYTNIALGDLYKDAVNIYYGGLGDE